MKNQLLILSLFISISSHAIDLVSVNSSGTGPGEVGSVSSKSSADGRYVAFYSSSTNLVSGQVDTNGTIDIFLRDTVENTTSLVSHTPSAFTTSGNDASVLNDISADGRYIAFTSLATDLVTGFTDNNSSNSDIFVYDRIDQSVKLVSAAVGSSTSGSSGHSNMAYISPDGSKIAFTSLGNNLVNAFTDNNGSFNADLYLRFIGSSTTVLVSHNSASFTASGNSDTFTVKNGFSGDGTKLIYTSYSTNLISGGGDISGDLDVFQYNVNESTNTLVSHAQNNALNPGNHASLAPVISHDGSTIAFQSLSSNLISGFVDHTGGATNVYKYDTTSGVITLVSHATTSTLDSGNGASSAPAINYNGAAIAYLSNSTDLITGITDSNGGADIFLLKSNTNELVSVASSGTAAGNFVSSGTPVMSQDGRKVAFATLASNLSALPDSNSSSDYYVRDLVTGVTQLAITNEAGTQASGAGSSEVNLCRNGIIVTSYSTDILSTDNNEGAADIFFNRLDLISVSSPSAATYIDASSVTIAGSAESGSLVKVYADTDGDGKRDDDEISVAEEQLLAGISTFSISTPIVKSSANHFLVVSADILEVESLPEVVPTITDVPTYTAKLLRNKRYITLKVTDEDRVVRMNRKPFGNRAGKAVLSRKDFNGDGIRDIQVRTTINGKIKRQRYSGVDLRKI